MRNAFAAEITALAAADPRLVLLCSDIGNRLFDDYQAQCPNRFMNCGVAEANMISMAAGMALCGLRPITYTITPFITTRCLEQIRVDLCYQNLPVIIVGIGSGLCYASLNATHHSCEDIALMRVLPNMTVVCPADAWEVRLALRAAVKNDGPVYLRLGKKGEPAVHKQAPVFTIGKGIVVCRGDDVCLLSTGNILPVAVEAAKELGESGVSTQVVSFHTVKPLDQEMLGELFAKFKIVVTLEEHSILGGLGGSVAEWLTDQTVQKARLCRLGTDDRFMYEAGEQDHAREFYGLTAGRIAQRVFAMYLESSRLEM